MTSRFETESGSIYEIRDTPLGHQEVRRVNPDAAKRADDQWIRLISHTATLEGYRVILCLESLGKYGPDDEGNRHGGATTIRTTTPVTRVWHDDKETA